MNPYLPHLISDIKGAYRKEVQEDDHIPQSMEEHFEEIESWLKRRRTGADVWISLRIEIRKLSTTGATYRRGNET